MGPDITFCPIIKSLATGEQTVEMNRYSTPEIPAQLRDAFWVVELEDDGTVIYSRPSIMKTGDGSETDLEGHNFFEEVLGFEDIARCRRHFKSFIDSNKAAERFVWRCSSPDGTMDTKVLMTRGFQTGYDHSTGVVMMEIRANSSEYPGFLRG